MNSTLTDDLLDCVKWHGQPAIVKRNRKEEIPFREWKVLVQNLYPYCRKLSSHQLSDAPNHEEMMTNLQKNIHPLNRQVDEWLHVSRVCLVAILLCLSLIHI